MLRITLANLYAHKARLVLSSLAIVLGVAFVSGTFVFTGAIKASFFSAFARDVGKADVVLTAPEQPDVSQDVLATVRGVEGVAHAAGRITGRTALHHPTGRLVRESHGTTIVSLARHPDLRWQEVTRGRLPDGRGEAVLDRGTAQRAGLAVGERIRVPRDRDESASARGSGDPAGDASKLRIVGLVDLGNSPQYAATPFLGVTAAQARALTEEPGYAMVLALGGDGVSASTLADRVEAAVASPYTVRTGAEEARQQASEAIGDQGVNFAMFGLLGFAGIALFVAAIVIANTFGILLAQRTRELALLRCVAATRGQVFRSVLLESAVLGLAGSVTGTAVGYGLATGVGAALHARLDAFPFALTAPTVAAVVVPIVLGCLATVAAAMLPARSATRIAPVAALRDQDVPTRRAGRVRLTFAAAALLAGVAGLCAGTLLPLPGMLGFLAAFAGGITAFGGILLAGPVLVPPVLRLAGALPARVLGTPGRLATANAVRNPRRAAATTSALLVGATLIATMTVGAASVRATVSTELDEQFPVDYAIGAGDAAIPDRVATSVRAVPGVADTATVRVAPGRVDGADARIGGVSPTALRAVTTALPALRELQPGQVALTTPLARKLDVAAGDRVRIGRGSGRSERLEVGAVRQQLLGTTAGAVVSERDFRSVLPGGGDVGVLLAELRESASARDVTAAIHDATAGVPGLDISGAAEVKATFMRALDAMLLVATALLGVAVVIAVVGIANTLSLSVIERTRESGLMRAMGLTRGQLRGMLAGEAVLIGLVGGLLGVALGIVFGWAGVTVLAPPSSAVVLAVPAGRIAALVAVAALAALLASVVPGRRAARASVVSALAHE